jgi:hypothetical protein
MIDLDIYRPNLAVEEFLSSLKVRIGKDHPTTTVYISTTNPYRHWIYNNTELMEEKTCKKFYSTYSLLVGDYL